MLDERDESPGDDASCGRAMTHGEATGDAPTPKNAMGDSAMAPAATENDASAEAGGGEVDPEPVRIDYEFSSMSVAAIQEKYGLSEWRLKRMQRAGKWTMRPQRGRGPIEGAPPAGADALAFRLNRLITHGLAMLEHGVAEEGWTEGNLRMLNELCRATRTMHAILNKKAVKARETTDDDAARSDDPAQILRELAARFDRIREESAETDDPQAGEQ